jgi:hypothetical protein
MSKINVAGVEREMTSEEESELAKVNAKIKADEEAEATLVAKIEADKASGNKKLKDLGLTDDEITALVG